MKTHKIAVLSHFGGALCAAALSHSLLETGAQPILVDSHLGVREVVAGLVQPTSMAFLGANDILVLEKSTGKVLRVVDGVVTAVVLDLAVNSASERGLLGIALHPGFPENAGVYLYWTESLSGMDSTDIADVPPRRMINLAGRSQRMRT